MDTDSPAAVLPVLKQMLGDRGIRPGARGGEFVIDATMAGEDPKALNRTLLSALRRAEKKTRLRAEWTSPDGTTFRFFAYVLKKVAAP